MNDKTNIKALIEKFHQDSLDTEELDILQKWILDQQTKGSLSPEANKLFASYWLVSEAVERKPHEEIQQSWNVLSDRIDQQKTVTFYPEKPKKTAFSISKIAAILIPLLLSLGVIYYFLEQQPAQDLALENRLIEKVAKKGEKISFKLPDGSKVKLNADTKISFAEGEAFLKNREVHLEGEAFFEVTKRMGQNFKVLTSGSFTEVLGTQFNVNSREGVNNVQVAVLEGKVKVVNDNNKENVLLLPNEMVTFEKDEEILTKAAIEDLETIFGWRENILVFNATPVEEVLQKLELWYGVEFILPDNFHIEKKFKGRFENLPLQTVLDGLGFSSQFNYEIEKNKKVIITTK